MRTAALFAIPVWLLYVLWRDHSARLLAVAAAATLLPLVGYAAVHDAHAGKFGLTGSDGWFLYGRVGEIADCRRFDPPPGTRNLCEPLSRSHGAGALYYIWGDSPARRFYGQPGTPGSSEPLKRFATAVIRARPFAYAEIVGRDLLRYARPGYSSRGGSDNAITLPDRPRVGRPWVNEQIRAAYVPSYVPPAHAPAKLLNRYRQIVHTPRPLLALLVLATIVALLVALAGRPLPRRREAFLLTGMGLAMLVGATATSAFVVRYLVPSMPFIVCGGTLALADLWAARRTGASGTATS